MVYDTLRLACLGAGMSEQDWMLQFNAYLATGTLSGPDRQFLNRLADQQGDGMVVRFLERKYGAGGRVAFLAWKHRLGGV